MACAACTTTLRDVPPSRKPDATKAMIAARMDFAGTQIDSTLRLRSLQGKELKVQPEYMTFLVEMPPGSYELQRVGNYVPKADRLTFQAKAGVINYIGSFRGERDAYGELRLVIEDEMMLIAEELVDRYGPELPDMVPGLIRSAQVPTNRKIRKLTIPLVRVAPSYPPATFSVGLGFYGVYGGGGYQHDPGHGSGGTPRGSHASRGSRHGGSGGTARGSRASPQSDSGGASRGSHASQGSGNRRESRLDDSGGRSRRR